VCLVFLHFNAQFDCKQNFGIAKDAANESLIPSHGAVSDLNRREEYLVPAAQFSAHSQRAFSRLFPAFSRISPASDQHETAPA